MPRFRFAAGALTTALVYVLYTLRDSNVLYTLRDSNVVKSTSGNSVGAVHRQAKPNGRGGGRPRTSVIVDATDGTVFDFSKHCVVHTHGIHHSGTGFLRQTLFDSLGAEEASMHVNSGKAQDEGQHIQSVYPVYKVRLPKNGNGGRTRCVPEGAIARRNYGKPYYCPSMLSIADDPRKVHTMFAQWAKVWDMDKHFLLQKTPTLDVQFLERAKLGPSFHAVVMGHPLFGVRLCCVCVLIVSCHIHRSTTTHTSHHSRFYSLY